MSNACCKLIKFISYFKKVYNHNSILSLNSLDEAELCDVKKQLLKNLYVYNNNFILKNISNERKCKSFTYYFTSLSAILVIMLCLNFKNTYHF